MKAIICTKYGPPEVLKLRDIEKPIPKNNEVLIKLHSVTVTTEDPLNRRGEPLFARIFTGFKKPKNPILGAEFSGEIETIGKNVNQFKAGELVFGTTGTAYGCYAEYVCVPEKGFLAKKPSNIAFKQAAPVCGALAAWNHLVDKANIQSGQKVLINGASGAVGTAAVQIANYFGAIVTGVCSTKNIDLVKSLGAINVIDYTKVDFTQSKQSYDIIYDVSSTSSFTFCKGSLTQNGIYLRTVLGPLILLQMLLTSIIGSKKAIFSATGLIPVPKRLEFLKHFVVLLEKGKRKTVIDRCYPLEQIVEAQRYVEVGRKQGNVVIVIEHDNRS